MKLATGGGDPASGEASPLDGVVGPVGGAVGGDLGQVEPVGRDVDLCAARVLVVAVAYGVLPEAVSLREWVGVGLIVQGIGLVTRRGEAGA